MRAKAKLSAQCAHEKIEGSLGRGCIGKLVRDHRGAFSVELSESFPGYQCEQLSIESTLPLGTKVMGDAFDMYGSMPRARKNSGDQRPEKKNFRNVSAWIEERKKSGDE